jgi:MoCo/4Fe-4S cofactor protein with predicted Tat translocation signal
VSSLDLEAIRARLDSAKGPLYWKSLEEAANSEEFQKLIEDEFPNRVPDFLSADSRRTFLKLMAASLALAGVTACTKQPPEMIVPYVRQPPDFTPGLPLFYATAMPHGGAGTGILVESHLGRPTKVEGNPDHPASLGGSSFIHQASLLTMYDPDRSQTVLHNGQVSSWPEAQGALLEARAKPGLRILTDLVSSPTLTAQIDALLKNAPGSRWHQYEPSARIDSQIYRFNLADVIVSLDSDFLFSGPACLRYARDFAARRHAMTSLNLPSRPKEDRQEGYQDGPAAPWRSQSASHADQDSSPLQHPAQVRAQGVPLDQITQNRLYVFEPHPTPTGSLADHRYPMRSIDIEVLANDLASALKGGGTSSRFKDLNAMAQDLLAHRGSSIVIAGEFQSPQVHALVLSINQTLGNVGRTILQTGGNPVDSMASLQQLVSDINAGKVSTLVIAGGNPAYNAPVDLGFARAVQKVQTRFRLGLYDDETSDVCNWHIPLAHYLESWSDTRAFDGTASIIQPLIAPLYGGITAHQLLSVLNGEADQAPYDIVRDHWRDQMGADFETAWQKALHDGVVPNSAQPFVIPQVESSSQAAQPAASSSSGSLELVLRPDPTIGDGAWSNNGWLQELPKPQNKMTWDNAAWISPSTAQKLNVTTEDLVELKYRGRVVQAAIWVMPGHANDCVTAHFGYGRTHAGHVGTGIGFNAYLLQTSDAPGGGQGLEIRKLGGRYTFATTQHAQTMEEREPVRAATLAGYKADPFFALGEEGKKQPEAFTLYPDYAYEGYKWGMTIDLNSCMGCGSCIIACQSENNIPVVGKAETAKGRHMASWIRVDRYYKGNLDDPELYFQPVPCMQCESAPCELVCPVAATVHSGDGLNQMIYNRCVGTRYCSNNCPYKVRRFNFFLYSDWYTQSLYPMRNPEVTVRSRGVMEKCTYCIQRIEAAKIDSEKQMRRIRDGEVVPACAQSCPTQAIAFGDINDPKSQVAQLKAQPRNYSLLAELNTRPRTTYLGRLRNPNPEIEHA